MKLLIDLAWGYDAAVEYLPSVQQAPRFHPAHVKEK